MAPVYPLYCACGLDFNHMIQIHIHITRSFEYITPRQNQDFSIHVILINLGLKLMLLVDVESH